MSFLRMLRAQRYAIWALTLREIQITRGPLNRGYVEVITQPIYTMSMFIIIRYVMGRQFEWAFMIVGFMLFFGFRQIYNKCLEMPNTNKGVFLLPHIRPLDMAIAQSLAQWYAHVFCMALLLAVIACFGLPVRITDWQDLVLGPVMIGLFGFGFGMSLRGLCVYYPFIRKLNMFLNRGLLWVSGVFFSPSELPESMQVYFSWNPIAIALEMARHGLGMTASPQMLNFPFLVASTMLLAMFGMLLARHTWKERRQ